jgi:hypothetical protein
VRFFARRFTRHVNITTDLKGFAYLPAGRRVADLIYSPEGEQQGDTMAARSYRLVFRTKTSAPGASLRRAHPSGQTTSVGTFGK